MLFRVIPVWWTRQACSSTVCMAPTQNPGLRENCLGSVTYLVERVRRVELAKHSFNIKTTKLLMSALKPRVL